VIGAPLGVADNDILGAGIGQHTGGDVAGMGAGCVGVAILPAGQNAAGCALTRYRCEDGRGRTNHHNGARRFAGDEHVGQCRQFVQGRPQAVHFPVPCDQRRYCRCHSLLLLPLAPGQGLP